MIEDYRINLVENINILEQKIIQVANIKEFIINNKSYKLNNFKSLQEAYKFLSTNLQNLSYLKTEEFTDYLYPEVSVKAFYMKDGCFHRLDGPSYIELIFNNNHYYIFKELYYIKNQILTKEEWQKSPELRKNKLKRLLK